MAKLKVPSLQHLARNWRDTPQLTQKVLVSLARSSPTFSYDALFSYVRDMMLLGVPYSQIVEAVGRSGRRADVKANFLGVLPLIQEHFEGVAPTFVQGVARRYYPAGRGLMVPFDPPLIYGANGEIVFPWFSFWRHNPLAGERLALFTTLVQEVLLQDPDLEEAKFRILDFSAAKNSPDRELIITEVAEVSRVSEVRKAEMLEVFAEGYFLARTQLAAMPDKQSKSDEGKGDETGDSDQLDLL